MYLLTVAPLVQGMPHDYLSYFSKDKLEKGDLCEISIKKRNCRALVLHVANAKEERQSLRHANFGLKKINKVIHKGFIPNEIWKAIDFASSYTLQPVGKIIFDLIPERAYTSINTFCTPTVDKSFELLLLQQNYKDRLTRYKTTVRESFAKKQSMVIFFPTIIELEYAQNELSRGIEDYVVSFHSGLTDKQGNNALLKIKDEQHPLLILSTPTLLPWTRKDLGLCVIEREHSSYYYTHGNQSYDMRFIIKKIAENTKIPCVLGSHTLSLDAHLAFKRKDAFEIMPIHFRNDAPISIIKMSGEHKSASPFLSKEAVQILHEMKLEKSGHVFMYAHRKGMYPTTICSDCSTLFTCEKCNRPYVLHKIAGTRTYVCHECEHIIRLEKDTSLSCKNCGSWRMETLGIATGGVEEDLKKLGIPTFIIDGERTNTRSKVKKVYKEWMDSNYGVLIGTEMAHNILEKVDNIIILSLDSLFSLPEYRTDEKILNLVTEMAEKIKEGGKLLLQTRLNPPILKHLKSHTFAEFYRETLVERDNFLLPPYYVVIKASFENLADELRFRIEQELDPYVVEWFEAGRGKTLLFIHINEREWVNNEQLRERIKLITQPGNPEVNPLNFFI